MVINHVLNGMILQENTTGAYETMVIVSSPLMGLWDPFQMAMKIAYKWDAHPPKLPPETNSFPSPRSAFASSRSSLEVEPAWSAWEKTTKANALWKNGDRTNTRPETNIAPENRPSQKETSIPTIHFQGLC